MPKSWQKKEERASSIFFTPIFILRIYTKVPKKNITYPSLKPRRWLSITQKPAAKATCLV